MAEKDDDIVARAHKRFKACQTWESDARQRFKDDIRFLYADPDNQEQWDAAVRARRQIQGQPMVTINKTHTHWLHVVNQAKEFMPSVKISATGGNATYESAQIMMGVVRHIEYKSKAVTAYKTACEQQVGGGIGYWRIVTDYSDDNSFDQDIFIKQVQDSLSVSLDPNIKNKHGSDARFGFIYEDIHTELCERRYPNVPVVKNQTVGGDGWVMKDTVRIAHYFEIEEKKEWLYAIPDDDDFRFVRESDMDENQRKLIQIAYKEGAEGIQRRRVDKRTVKSYVIVGNKIAEKGIWPGKFIPIIRVPGEEIVIEGRLDRKGLVRYLKDAQRAYNYNTSASLEFGALQSKSPYMAPAEAIEGHENYWATANTANHAYLPYNHVDKNGNPIPPPSRQDPPTGAPVFMQGMQAAEREMMMASGQYEATFSEQGNEIAGVAISERKQQGERVTFHFLDNLADAIAFTGEQLIDLIPKIYDTKRIVKILAEDGEEQSIQIDPESRQAVQMQENESENKVRAVFNPAVGKYAVVAEAGPNYETRRKEAFSAMTNLLGTNQELPKVMGDLYMGSADFPLADKLQERMRAWIKLTNPGILGEGPTPQEQQMQQQIQLLSQQLQAAIQELQSKEEALQLEKQRIDMDAVNHLAIRMENERQDTINAFKAETDRIAKLIAALTPEQLQAIAAKTAEETLAASDPNQDNPALMDPSQAFALGMPAFAGSEQTA